ncbi:hypothetical protein C8R44DRAFT_744799 [Mycena epipterygia]|nr:hypothetical protein C8R44DRAFT_744799 [Mycena epipterygia]
MPFVLCMPTQLLPVHLATLLTVINVHQPSRTQTHLGQLHMLSFHWLHPSSHSALWTPSHCLISAPTSHTRHIIPSCTIKLLCMQRHAGPAAFQAVMQWTCAQHILDWDKGVLKKKITHYAIFFGKIPSQWTYLPRDIQIRSKYRGLKFAPKTCLLLIVKGENQMEGAHHMFSKFRLCRPINTDVKAPGAGLTGLNALGLGHRCGLATNKDNNTQLQTLDQCVEAMRAQFGVGLQV